MILYALYLFFFAAWINVLVKEFVVPCLILILRDTMWFYDGMTMQNLPFNSPFGVYNEAPSSDKK